MFNWWQTLGRRERSLFVLIILAAVLVTSIDRGFLSTTNLRDILVRGAPIAIVACGVMLVVVSGEIDISVGSLMALLAAVMGLSLSRDHAAWSSGLGLPLILGLGTLAGWATGVLVTVGRVPSIMVTLGLLTALRGLTTIIMRGGNIQNLPDGLTRWTKQGLFGLPLSIWTAGVVLAVTAWIIHRTALGRRIYAVGSSRQSAAMAGLSEGRLKRFVFAYTGFLTALATIVDVPRLPQIEAGIGNELELLVVTCVVVGGVSISGGRGSLTGVVLAIVLMTLIRPMLTFMAVGESGEKWTKAIQGLLILAAVVADHAFAAHSRREPT
ncbi:ABC transporter permease [Schlesneria paludicola]|uniref:ABC transporter permease n=1 Tax=Schlesneria paludicola TaxID=360056 RepID=UPI00029A765C|nr:ABC transporter permease [Schlesneria paludicola]